MKRFLSGNISFSISYIHIYFWLRPSLVSVICEHHSVVSRYTCKHESAPEQSSPYCRVKVHTGTHGRRLRIYFHVNCYSFKVGRYQIYEFRKEENTSLNTT